MAGKDDHWNRAMDSMNLVREACSIEAQGLLREYRNARAQLAHRARSAARRSRTLVDLYGPFQRARVELSRDALLAEIGKQLRASYRPVEDGLPDRLAVLVEQVERLRERATA